jgi:aspartate racemase
LLVATYREKKTDGSYPLVIINSIDLQQIIHNMEAKNYAAVADIMVAEIEKLVKAGADFGLISSNTPHIVFDDIRHRSRLPLLSIVEATCEHARGQGLKKLALFGSGFTMKASFYPEIFARAGITVFVPEPGDQHFIHDKYMNELVHGVFLPETRARLLGIVESMKKQHGIDGLILGGTELPLILRDANDCGIPFLDTARIHVDAAVREMLG